MSGINEWLQQGEHSKYVTPKFPRWLAFLIGFAIGLVFGFMLGISTAHASPACMTLHEARHIWPREYLSWRGEHCWERGERRSHKHSQHVLVKIPRDRPEAAGLRIEKDWTWSDNWWFDELRPDMANAMLRKAAQYRLQAGLSK